MLLVLLTKATVTYAEEPPLPVLRQAELLVRVAAYDRNLAARAGDKVRVLIVVNPEDPDSRKAGAAMESALRRFDKIAGLASEITSMPFAGAVQLAAQCRAHKIAIVYITPGLEKHTTEIAQALNGVDVLTASAIPRFVRTGIVLGFDLVSGKPTLMINLPQAKRQNVAIEPKVVQLMTVIQ